MIVLAVAAQAWGVFSISSFVVGGGGGASSVPQGFSVHSTIGEPIVGIANNGTRTVQSGYWPGVAPSVCVGDADSNGTVNFDDINSALSNWLTDYSPGTGPGDANADGVVNFTDINDVLAHWLETCP